MYRWRVHHATMLTPMPMPQLEQQPKGATVGGSIIRPDVFVVSIEAGGTSKLGNLEAELSQVFVLTNVMDHLPANAAPIAKGEAWHAAWQALRQVFIAARFRRHCCLQECEMAGAGNRRDQCIF